ncbi:unnamed protein product [Rhodiola kirilowii]
MEQPKLPTTSLQQSSAEARENRNRNQKPPTPKEMIALYESKGMEPQEAAEKVIGDLQGMLFRMASTRRGKKEKFMTETSKKLDNAQTRLTILEMKLDSKPGIGQSFAVGMAAGAAVNGLGSVWGGVATGAAEIWGAVRRVTKSSPAP